MSSLCIPKDLLHIILEYDGRIKYRHGKYVDIIHKRDNRYNILAPVMHKKTEIMKTTQRDGTSFYFEFGFDFCNSMGLCYDYNFSYDNRCEICYYDFRNGLKQIRTYL
jgi:hypothetical protein